MIRCSHCGLLHVSSRTVCPTTGLTIVASGGDRRTTRNRGPSLSAVRRGELGGTVLSGRYQVGEVIGQGGMGSVFEATELASGRRVAVKVLRPEHAEKPESVKRLHREAEVVGRLKHRNICAVFDTGQLPDGSPYVVMERLHGETLASVLERSGPIGIPRMLRLMVQVLEGLSIAHAHGVVHRDMKPDNIFLARSASGEQAKVVDFGISKAVVGDDKPHHLTRTGMVMGTPYYMAPEQAMGERDLDGRVDVWGCGIALYEGLAGVRPFVAKNYNALLVQILTANATPIEEHRKDLPAGLGDVVRRALEKKRERRFADVRQFQSALKKFLIAYSEHPARLVEDVSSSSDDDDPTVELPTRLLDQIEDDMLIGEGDPTVVDEPPSFADTETTERRRS